MPLFVPDINSLNVIFQTGKVGIADAMSAPGMSLDVNMPGLPNFESAIFKGLQKPFEPQLQAVKVVGTLIEASKEFATLINPAEITAFIQKKILEPVAEGTKLIKKFVPPTIPSISSLIVVPIEQYLKIPQIPSFSLPLFGLHIPFPSIGDPKLPPLPLIEVNGILLPQMMHMILGIIMLPINILMNFLDVLIDFFKAVVNPLKLIEAVTNILKLPLKLLPTLDMLKSLISIPFTDIMLTFIAKVFDALLNMFKLMFGLGGTPIKEA